MKDHDARIALLIDADNSPAKKIDVILSELAKYGVANVRRAYGNWKDPGLKGWEAVLHENAIRPIQQFAYTKGKNATDVALVIDAMDLLYTQNLDAFCLVSSDSDFTPLVMRILTNGLRVYGFGEQKTPMPFVSACSRFTFLEALGEAGVVASVAGDSLKAQTAKELLKDKKLVQLLKNAVEFAAGDDGWSHLGKVGQHVSNQASFDSRNYGFKKLSELIEAISIFEIRRDNLSIWIRNRPGDKAGPKSASPDPKH